MLSYVGTGLVKGRSLIQGVVANVDKDYETRKHGNTGGLGQDWPVLQCKKEATNWPLK
jgi:hypothetical protein